MIRYICMLIGLNALFVHLATAQVTVRIETSERVPLEGATVRLLKHDEVKFSDAAGIVLIDPYLLPDTVEVTLVGFMSRRVALSERDTLLHIVLTQSDHLIEEVLISTGYQQSTREKLSGSYTHVDNEMLNRSVGSNILQRLEGIVPGVQFVQAGSTAAEDIRVRGLATIESDSRPLIVVDNFPYEGDIESIDPDMVENITVLKDAVASSIWGARAGNGVIVITTKSAKGTAPVKVNFHANSMLGGRPDLTYSRSWLPSTTVMEIESYRYGMGHYRFADNTSIPVYVDLLKQHEEGTVSESELRRAEAEFERGDFRQQAMQHLYGNSLLQQYALNVSTSRKEFSNIIGASYNTFRDHIRYNGSKRVVLNIKNRYMPISWLDLGLNGAFSKIENSQNGFGYNDFEVSGVGISPYWRLVDDQGNNLPLPRSGLRTAYTEQAISNGLLDWMYRPLDERMLSDTRNASNEVRVQSDVVLRPFRSFSISLMYQYTGTLSNSLSHYGKDSYYVRNLVNRFTQSNGARLVPHNGILDRSNDTQGFAHYGRVQSSWKHDLSEAQHISFFGGMEIRHQTSQRFPGMRLYNYDEKYLIGENRYDYTTNHPVRPEGRSRIPLPSDIHRYYTNRDLSYFANADYALRGKYILNGSIRWDASNLFGVKTNQKGVPLWSLGGAWKISEESFYPLGDAVPHARLRATYGISGNVNKTVTHVPTISLLTSVLGVPMASLRSIGNPSLRWEQVSTWNYGLDLSSRIAKIELSIDYYRKQGNDLIGEHEMDPTTGIQGSYKINYANILTKGWDVQVRRTTHWGHWRWSIDMLGNWVDNTVTNYSEDRDLSIARYLGDTPVPVVGKSRDVRYVIPWQGLSPENGYPLVKMDEALSQAYQTYYDHYLTVDDLEDRGVMVPTHYGSFRNTLSYKRLQFSVLMTWKSGAVFRRTSMMPGGEFSNSYHEDYYHRWKTPGDELSTNVPAFVALEDLRGDYSYMSAVYNQSSILIESADHIRIQDINLTYSLPKLGNAIVKDVRLTAYVRNLGIIWKRNSHDIDPDYVSSLFRAPRYISLGIQLNI